MSNILVFNVGSSSCKFQVFTDELEFIGKGQIEKVGIEGTNAFYKDVNGNELTDEQDITFDQLDQYVVDFINKNNITNLTNVSLVAHRVVNGGDVYQEDILINSISDIDRLEEINHLAPLHNPFNCMMLRSLFDKLPNAKHVVVFDTSFHSTIKEENFVYPIPYKYYEFKKIRKYGAHGSSHAYITEVMKKHLNKEVNIINLHLGNGASACAIKESKSVNTSMGLTPLAGLMMGTRCGDIDPSVVLYMINTLNIEPKEVERILLKESGLLGVSGVSSDMREVSVSIDLGIERAALARKMAAKRVAQTTSSYLCELDSLDAITFTGGIGENDIEFIRMVANYLPNLDIKLKDEIENEEELNLITTDDSKVKVYIVRTNEELYMATVGKRLTSTMEANNG